MNKTDADAEFWRDVALVGRLCFRCGGTGVYPAYSIHGFFGQKCVPCAEDIQKHIGVNDYCTFYAPCEKCQEKKNAIRK